MVVEFLNMYFVFSAAIVITHPEPPIRTNATG